MLIQGNCIKENLTDLTLTLYADTGKSYLVKGIFVLPDGADTYHILRVDRKTVGVYRVYGKAGNHLGHPAAGILSKNLMGWCTDNGINVSIPVAEGQRFILTKGNAASHVVVLYDVYSAGDIRADMPNGSEAKQFTFIQYMDAKTYPSVSGDVELNVSLSPAEFPDFPCGKVVPSKHTIELLGVVGCPCGDATDGSNYIVTDYVKFVKDRETLFSEDRDGLIFRNRRPINYGVQYHPDITQIGPCVPISVDEGHIPFADPLLFDPVLRFIAGEELLVYLTMTLVGSHTLEAGAIDLAAITRVRHD